MYDSRRDVEMLKIELFLLCFSFQSTRRDAALSISEAVRGEAGPFTIGITSDIDKEKRDENELK